MRALLVLLPCVACNSLLGLDGTNEKLVDAPPAPPACQPLPTFGSQPMELSSGRSDYISDPHELMLAVSWNFGAMKIQEAMPGTEQFTDSLFVDPLQSSNSAPRLAPSGDQLFVRTVLPTQGGAQFRQFERGQGEWASPSPLTFAITAAIDVNDVISAPTAGGVQRHLVLCHAASGHTFYEMFEASPASWKADGRDATYVPAMLGLDDFEDPYLTPDALALVFVGTLHGVRDIYIAVRESIRPFTAADLHVLYHPPTSLVVHTPFVNADCGRLYFSTSDGTFYVTP